MEGVLWQEQYNHGDCIVVDRGQLFRSAIGPWRKILPNLSKITPVYFFRQIQAHSVSPKNVRTCIYKFYSAKTCRRVPRYFMSWIYLETTIYWLGRSEIWYIIWGIHCKYIKWGVHYRHTIWGIHCRYMKWGIHCRYMKWGIHFRYIKWGVHYRYTIWGIHYRYMKWGIHCRYMK